MFHMRFLEKINGINDVEELYRIFEIRIDDLCYSGYHSHFDCFICNSSADVTSNFLQVHLFQICEPSY